MAFTQGRAKIRGKAHQNLAEADRLEAGGSDPKNWKVDIPVPDFSTLSRRGLGLRLPAKPRVDRTEPIHLTMDSTGLKIFGEGEWLQVKHETKAKRKSWRKLHLGLDLTTGEIICSDLTLDHVGDSTALPGLLDQFDGPVSRFLADGAYDGTPTRNLLTARFGDAVEVIIPPPKTPFSP